MKIGETKFASFAAVSLVGSGRPLNGLSPEWEYELENVFISFTTSAVVGNRYLGLLLYNGSTVVGTFVTTAAITASSVCIMTWWKEFGADITLGPASSLVNSNLPRIRIPPNCRAELYCINPQAGDVWGEASCVVRRTG